MPKTKNTKTRTGTLTAPSKVPSKKSIPKAVALKTSPKDVFLHLLMLVMLYIGVISLISLSFAYINHSFPDPLSYDYGSWLLDDIRWQSSMLVVSFPLLLILSYFVQREFRKNPKKHELRFYKWLTYLTLFIAAITIVIDLIQLVNRFYSGELTLPFTLKVLSVLAVAGAVFGYYIWDVQTESYKSKVPALVGWITSIVVIAMLALGFILAGSPQHQRDIRMDEQRVADLSLIQSEVIYYWQNKRELPESLDVLENDLSYFRLPEDPVTGEFYEYSVLEPLKFKLCANFTLKNGPDDLDGHPIPAPVYDYKYPVNYDSNTWDHDAGYYCFERTIDPDLYPESEG